MNIVVLSDYDSSGNMYNLCSGVNRYTEHHATAIKLRVHPIAQYPSMIVATEDNMPRVRRMIYDADAVVFKEFWWIAERFGINMDKLKGKRLVAVMGGGGFRFKQHRGPNITFFMKHHMKIATTSADFLEVKPDMAWIPPCVRYDELREKYDYTKTKPPLVFASPSKDTDLRLHLRRNFLSAMSQLKDEGLNFRAQCPTGAHEMISNDECLRLKAPSSIFFDRIYDIYGLNSQEAATFECAVVTGINDVALRKLRQFGFECPFIIVRNYTQAKNAVRKLLKNGDYRFKKAEECRQYAERLHSGRESAKRLVALVEGRR